MRPDIEDIMSNNQNRGFKSSNKIYRKIFNKYSKSSHAIDKFGEPYFYSTTDDETEPISITLPKSMIVKLDEYCKENGVTRSRLIRKMVEYSLNLKKV